MADDGKPPGIRWLNAISWLAPACFLHLARLLLNQTWKGNDDKHFGIKNTTIKLLIVRCHICLNGKSKYCTQSNHFAQFDLTRMWRDNVRKKVDCVLVFGLDVGHGWGARVTCCIHMDGVHAGLAYASHMEAVERIPDQKKSKSLYWAPGSWGWNVRAFCCAEQTNQQVAFKRPDSV